VNYPLAKATRRLKVVHHVQDLSLLTHELKQGGFASANLGV